MPVLRIQAQHSMKHAKQSDTYVKDAEKTTLGIFDLNDVGETEHIQNAFTYAANPDKTTLLDEKGETVVLVSGYRCKPDTAMQDFESTMKSYYTQTKEKNLGEQTGRRPLRVKVKKDANGEMVYLKDQEGNYITDLKHGAYIYAQAKQAIDSDGNLVFKNGEPVYELDNDGNPVYLKDNDGNYIPGIPGNSFRVMESYKVKTQARTSYMWVQSFPPAGVLGYDIDPRLVHQIGMEFCERLEHYQCTVSTHMNTIRDNKSKGDLYHGGIHNHIMMCAYNMDEPKKYHDNMETLAKMRDISDELSLKYGIPIIMEPSTAKGVSWFEWKQRHDGQSWKETMKRDIRGMMETSSSWDEFRRNMSAAGYQMRETTHSVTYTMPGNDNFKCRDRILGDEFRKDNLIEYWEQRAQLKDRKHMLIDPAAKVTSEHGKKINIFVSRYSASGRRRSQLEMIILVAIKIINAVKDKFADHEGAKIQPDNPIYRLSANKLSQMSDALHMIQELGIDSKEELDHLVRESGAKLSYSKKQVEDLKHNIDAAESTIEKIENLKELKEIMDSLGIDDKDIMLREYGEAEIRRSRAGLTPMSSEQRREMNIEISKNKHYRLACKYDEISFDEANKIIGYLKGTVLERPEVLITFGESDQRRLELKYEATRKKQTENIKEKYKDYPITPAQESRLTRIFSGKEAAADKKKLESVEGIIINTADLSQFDAMMLINYFMSDNPFDKPLVDEQQIAKLADILNENGFVANRPIETVTVPEYNQIMRFFGSDRKTQLPDLLKLSEPIKESHVVQIKELLELRGETINIPVESLSQQDATKLYTYLLNKDVMPECLERYTTDSNIGKDKLFDRFLAGFTPQEQQYIYHYRELKNELASYGITELNMLQAEQACVSLKNEYEETVQLTDELKNEYKNLVRLKYSINLAENRSFTHGPLYDEVNVPVTITEQDKVADEQRREEEEIEKKANENKAKDSRKEEFFRSVDKYFNTNFDF